ncbi:MAG: class I SAM-dependent methyltransferase [Jatrophihabitantaceae bacterium]
MPAERGSEVRSGPPTDIANGTRRADPLPGTQVDALLIDALGAGIGAARVVDCGGGSGRFAVPLAVAGATVTVIDISIDALATLRRRAIEAGVADRVVAVQGDVENLAEALSGDTFDLVLAHGILDVVDPLPVTFSGIAAAVRPGGLLSVLVGNPVAGVLSRTLAGDLVGAERELAGLDDERGSGPGAAQRLCAGHGLIVEQQHGIGVFRDLVPGQALDGPGARDALARLEAACAQRRPFAEIAGRVHLLARRPDPAAPTS